MQTALAGLIAGGGMELFENHKLPAKAAIPAAVGTAVGGAVGYLAYPHVKQNHQDNLETTSKANKAFLKKYLKSRPEQGYQAYTAENYKPIFQPIK